MAKLHLHTATHRSLVNFPSFVEYSYHKWKPNNVIQNSMCVPGKNRVLGPLVIDLLTYQRRDKKNKGEEEQEREKQCAH